MSKRVTFLKGTSALVFLTLSSLMAEAHDQVRVSEPFLIEDPHNRSTLALDINNRGVVVGELLTAQLFRRPFKWSRRTGIIELPLAIENADAVANAINDCGEIVGRAGFPGRGNHAARWTRAGELEDLAALSDFKSSEAFDINELGAVVGAGVVDTTFEIIHAFLWTEAGGMRDLGTLGGDDSRAVAINNRNEVVGFSETATRHPCHDDTDICFNSHAFFWSERTGMIDLGSLEGGDRDRSSASGINDRGVVVGSSEVNDIDELTEDVHGLTWSRQRGLRPLAGGFSSLRDISRGGLIVGTSNDPSNERPARRHATLWIRNKIVNLSPNKSDSSTAEAINDKGAIAGAIPVAGRAQAAVWQIGRRFVNPPDKKEIDRLCKRPRH